MSHYYKRPIILSAHNMHDTQPTELLKPLLKHVHVQCKGCLFLLVYTVYFDHLEENDMDIQYTLRFPYEQYWFTDERDDGEIKISARTEK